jgi:hypothetical protein
VGLILWFMRDCYVGLLRGIDGKLAGAGAGPYKCKKS